MRSQISLASLLLAWSLLPAAQACDYPADLKLPDGKTATQEEITAASKAVKKYLADLDAYNACLDAEYAALPVEQQTPEAGAMKNKKYNATVDAMEAEAAAFNEQLRAFKAAQK